MQLSIKEQSECIQRLEYLKKRKDDEIAKLLSQLHEFRQSNQEL